MMEYYLKQPQLSKVWCFVMGNAYTLTVSRLLAVNLFLILLLLKLQAPFQNKELIQ